MKKTYKAPQTRWMWMGLDKTVAEGGGLFEPSAGGGVGGDAMVKGENPWEEGEESQTNTAIRNSLWDRSC